MSLSPFDLRTQLLDLIRGNLLGPADGPDEIVDEPTVRGRYILGVLAPAGQPSLLDLDEDVGEDQTSLDGAPDDDEDAAPDPTPQAAHGMMPTSIGLTFTVDGAVQAIGVTARWGRYTRRDHPDPAQLNKRGEPRRVWQRTPLAGVLPPIPLAAGPLGPWSPVPDAPGVVVRGQVRRRDDEWSVTLYLVNGQQEPSGRSPQGRDSAWLFQPEIEVTGVEAEPIFCKHLRGRRGAGDPEDVGMELAYRHATEFAVGHGVAVQAETAPGDSSRAVRLITRVLPEHEVGPTTPVTAAGQPALAAAVLDMQTLAALPDSELPAALSPLADAYAGWIEAQAAAAAAPELAPFSTVVPQTLANMRRSLARIRAGIDLLGRDPQAAAAFRFANRAMALQRVRSLYSERRRRGQAVEMAELDVERNRSWYPFQLAFLLLNLPAITDIRHPERSDPTAAVADLLWFPTGGGKTEAYLGLTAYTLAIRRLQGEVAGHSGAAGVAVLMRYTLRLLTLQQFQRAAALICACERIRLESLAAGDLSLGAEPFRIGLWVGGSSTPNTTDASAEALKASGGPRRGTPYQLTTCPWCGSEIRPDRHLRVEPYERGRGRTLMFCGDPAGACPFTERNAGGEGIPAVVVDEEVYRLLPSLLIATVDKFAQLPWKGETQMLFGRVDSYCPRHGYVLAEQPCGESHRATSQLPATRTVEAGPLRPPDLIIQDELHLISGPLGTLVGLYETAVDRLCEWEAGGPGESARVRPKLVASTATIRRARDQVFQLYLREVNVFPPPGPDARDNFFAVQRAPDVDTPGRCYVGIAAPGTRLKALMIRVYVAALAAAQKLYEEAGQAVDPYMTAVGYFNAMRELGSMRRAVDDAVSSRLLAADKRGLARRRLSPDSVEELTSRKSAADIPKTLDRLEWSFGKGSQKGRPIDVLLATNMISVGVDVSRLGLMIVGGQPKTTAEYIQATSRVGRRFPGLVLVVYNWARPRDLSHYERFDHYHATFYKQVEPLSVTPFSPRALDRGLTGVLVALIRLAGAAFNRNEGARAVTAGDPLVQDAIRTISRRAALAAADAAVEADTRERIAERIDSWLAQAQRTRLGYKAGSDGLTLALLKPAEGGERDLFVCLNSLREVEGGSPLILDNRGMEGRGSYTMPANRTAAPDERDAGAASAGAAADEENGA